MAYEQKENQGALFKNEDKSSDAMPDYKGSINVQGKDFWIAAWIKTSKKGQKFMSLSVQSKDKNERAGTVGRASKKDLDTDVPFSPLRKLESSLL